MAPLLLFPNARAMQSEAWQPLGLRGQTVSSLVATSRGGQRLIYAETATGLWRLDQGQDWQQIDAGLPRTLLGSPAVVAWRNVPGRPQQLYALTETGADRQLYRTDDGGASWQRIGPAPGQTAQPALLVLPGLGGQDLVIVATSRRAQRSSDGGASWTPGGEWPEAELQSGRNVEPVRALLGDSSAPDRLFAQAQDGSLWASESGGLSWRTLSPGAAVNTLAIAPYFGIRLWAGTRSGLGISTDNGNSWNIWPVPAASDRSWPGARGQIVALRTDPRVPETIYIALSGGTVYRSEDGGASWLSLAAPGVSRITALALDPDARNVLFAATDDGIWMRNVTPPQPTPTPTPIPTVLPPTETPTPAPSPTRTATATPTATLTPTLTATPSPTATLAPTATGTATRRPTALPTRTATATAVAPTWTPPSVAPPPELPPPQPGPRETPPATVVPTATPVPNR